MTACSAVLAFAVASVTEVLTVGTQHHHSPLLRVFCFFMNALIDLHLHGFMLMPWGGVMGCGVVLGGLSWGGVVACSGG